MTHTESIKVSPVQKALFTELKQLTISAETLTLLSLLEAMEPGQIAKSLTFHLCEVANRYDDVPGNQFSNKEVVYFMRLQQFLMSWQEDMDQEEYMSKSA
ncbi:hypothetical protein Oweho_3189 [Owenweeksia hongkongensis DSM 17368]|uniref:Uncharacterized protein n=1 Tax=Owenweeksia hongkongensis (strain DSM 17368 / CIP 108786 / JCM 12287 / NRRL B-23963 / UST20020801) TaxID=926562 RepID=G8R3Q3_OWEHD|nr:hypothetical protein [Owenweeksia hongkongensis]AEV34140.1 hypothetical protein Oweho_3189 [Owenweeksia hongkongensis DSM 17368]